MNNKIHRNYINYFYLLNYPPVERDFCRLEMKALFGKSNEDKYIFSHKEISPSTSGFIKEMVSIIYTAETVEEIADFIKRDSLNSEDFKVVFIRFDVNEARYEERMKAVSLIGGAIQGEPDLHNPKEIFAITKIEGKWIFGVFSKNDFNWHRFDVKPFSYSNSLSVKVSRTICNIASKGDKNCRLVDPCCGIGTVVLNALDLGLDIQGYEILTKIAANARDNLQHFGYDRDKILRQDMLLIEETYDVAILDLPYGLYAATTLEIQKALIKGCGSIAKRLVLVTSEDMEDLINECNFTVEDSCTILKNSFKRYIYVLNN